MLPRAKKPLAIEVLSPNKATNAGLYDAAEAVVRDWTTRRYRRQACRVATVRVRTGRLSTGEFQVAIADLRIGLDPDLYPLLASSQTLTGGSNVMGVQSADLDTLLEKARAPGFRQRTGQGGVQRAPEAARRRSLPAPAGLRGRGRRAPRHGPGTRRPAGHGRVGSILGCANMAPRCRPVTVGRGSVPRWRNRQTRWFQVPVAARSCGFKSLPRYHSLGLDPQ